MRIRGSMKQISFALILLIILFVVLFVANQGVALPFQSSYELNSPSGVFLGENQWKYVIDGAKKKILAIDDENHLEFIIHGNKETEGFYYASLIASDIENNIYVADTFYADRGTIIKSERILKYNHKGKYLGTIHEINYDDESLAPFQYGNILSLDYKDGFLIYTYKTDKGLEVYRIDTHKALVEKVNGYIYENHVIASADIDLETMLPVFITRTGEVYKIEENGSYNQVSEGNKSEISWKLDLYNNEIYYTNLGSKEIIKVHEDGLKELVYKDSENIIYQLSVKEGMILATDYAGIYIIEGEEIVYLDILNSGKLLINIIMFLCLILLLLTSLYLFVNMGYLLKGIWKNESFQKALIIVTVALFISTLVVYLALSSMFRLVDKNIMKDINLFCEIMVQATDTEALKQIDDTSDYKGEAYTKIKNELDQLIEASYHNGIYYYYIIYKLDQNRINGVMDYEDTMTSYHPFYELGDNSYSDVIKKNISVEFSNDASSYGTWSFVLKPILDEAGNGIGIMEIGVNTDEIVKEQNTLIKDIIITIVCSVIVMIIMMIEVVFYMQFQEEKIKSINDNKHVFRFPVRSLIFISFLADSMQDAFIPILVSKRYEQILGIPKEIGVAFPITMQLFTTAVFSFIGGGIVTRFGIKKTLIQGFLIQMIGYIICAVTTDYVGILVGKTIVGVGMGLIIVVVNTIAAVSGEESAGLFGEINAGILAGVTAGVGIGAVIISIQSYSAVYSVASLIILCGFIMTLFGEEYRPSVEKVVKTSMNIFTFILSREIITFLLFILTPFLIALSYREYFFPLYAQTMGMSESTIGYIYLLSGLIVIYLGPSLTKNLIHKIGMRKTVIVSSLLMCMAAFTFVSFSTLTSAVVGIFILSIAISFGYGAQSTYYSSRPIVSTYGEGRAMGVYALFDNGGQTLGPIMYGFALAFGFTNGVFFMGTVLTIFVLIFIVTNLKRGMKNV